MLSTRSEERKQKQTNYGEFERIMKVLRMLKAFMFVKAPHLHTRLMRILQLVLNRNQPTHMPTMYGPSRVHGLS